MSWQTDCEKSIDRTLVRASQNRTEEEATPLLPDGAVTTDKPEIKIVAGKDGTLACLSGRVDIDFSPAVRDQLLVIVKTADPKIVSIDLSGVTHLDSSGVATLIEALRAARSSRTQLTLRGLQGRLLRLFEITGILSLFNGSAEVSQPG